MILGLDYGGGRPGGAAIKAAGFRFVCRYLSEGGPTLPGKLLTPAECTDLQAHGIAVAVNWETTADRMKAGHSAGVADAQRADAQVRAVGHPADRPVYFSADWDATPADQAKIDDYLRGAASVIGPERVGVYGSYYVCKRCFDNGTARWAWQTGAWSGGNREPRAHIYQRIGFVTVGGVQCDVNEALKPDFGQHPEGADMTPEEHQWLREIHEESTRRLPTRVPTMLGEPTPPDAYADTVLGFACNSDAYGFLNQQAMGKLQAAVNALATAVAAQHGLSTDDIRAIFDQELAKIPKVRITAETPSPTTP
ncbi:MAG: DUF1906 domain-containing protein [Pseudonocardiaceae bacterium]